MIKGFHDFLNENESSRNFERSLDMVVYMSLGCFSPEGGNNSDWDWSSGVEVPEGIFGPEGPDLWVNCGDFNGEIPEELAEVAGKFKHPSKLDYHRNDFDIPTRRVLEKFGEYGMAVVTLIDGEVIVRIKFSDTDGALPFYQFQQRAGLKESWKQVVKFYTEIQPRGLKELEAKLGRGYIGGKRIGLI